MTIKKLPTNRKSFALNATSCKFPAIYRNNSMKLKQSWSRKIQNRILCRRDGKAAGKKKPTHLRRLVQINMGSTNKLPKLTNQYLWDVQFTPVRQKPASGQSQH
jgi:hypothetical protein